MGSLLSGKAISVYNELSIEELADFEVLKRALLVRYGLTENGYRARFKAISPRPDDDPSTYFRRIKESLEKWISAAKVDRNAESILEFLSVDKYLSTIPKDLATFLRERDSKDISELISSSERYLYAHETRLCRGSSSVQEGRKTHENGSHVYGKRNVSHKNPSK